MNFRNLFHRRVLVPFNYGAPDAPQLRVGDTLIGVLTTDTLDYIAGLCGLRMDKTYKRGSRRKWKVKELYGPNDALCTGSRGDRILLKYLPWSDGNKVTVAATLAHSRMEFRFYYSVPAAAARGIKERIIRAQRASNKDLA